LLAQPGQVFYKTTKSLNRNCRIRHNAGSNTTSSHAQAQSPPLTGGLCLRTPTGGAD
jgi:hypothetical protein